MTYTPSLCVVTLGVVLESELAPALLEKEASRLGKVNLITDVPGMPHGFRLFETSHGVSDILVVDNAYYMSEGRHASDVVAPVRVSVFMFDWFKLSYLPSTQIVISSTGCQEGLIWHPRGILS